MASNIRINRSSESGKATSRYLSMARESAFGINGQIAILSTFLTGDGTLDEHYDGLVAEGYAATNADAKASYLLLKSLSEQFVGLTTSLMGACARHGI